jgi:hypothetical protein
MLRTENDLPMCSPTDAAALSGHLLNQYLRNCRVIGKEEVTQALSMVSAQIDDINKNMSKQEEPVVQQEAPELHPETPVMLSKPEA